jgi:hypothetical protein
MRRCCGLLGERGVSIFCWVGGEARVSIAGEGSVEGFSIEAGSVCELSHAAMCLDDVAEAAASSRRAAEGVRMSPTSANAGCEQAARPVVFVVFSGNFGPGWPI